MIKLVQGLADRMVGLAVPAASAKAGYYTYSFCYCGGNYSYWTQWWNYYWTDGWHRARSSAVCGYRMSGCPY